MRLKDRVTIVTGSGAGIGRSSAIEFAREGARVVVADINAPGAQETVNAIQAAGGTALAVETDVSDPDSVQGLPEDDRAEQPEGSAPQHPGLPTKVPPRGQRKTWSCLLGSYSAMRNIVERDV